MRLDTTLGTSDEALDARLRAELDALDVAGTAGAPPRLELAASVTDDDGELAGGISGWTRGSSAGIALMWVRPDQRGDGTGAALVEAFEAEARRRGCDRVFATALTFHGPGLSGRQGYREVFRWDGAPVPEGVDVHLRKDL